MKISNHLRKSTLILALVLGVSACNDAPQKATPAAAEATPDVTILKWGPQGTKAGQTFSVQPTGNSALWFEQRGIHSAESVEVWFDQTQLKGMAITPNVGGSAEVPASLLEKPGKYPLYLIIKPQNKRIDIGIFEVTP